VEAAARTLADSRADAVVAVGGGSSIVTARAATVLLAENSDIRDLCIYRDPDRGLVSPRLKAHRIGHAGQCVIKGALSGTPDRLATIVTHTMGALRMNP
jgi:hypothetical protein